MKLVEFMHLENLKLYRKQLAAASNEGRRKRLLTLLTEELGRDQKYPNANIGVLRSRHRHFIRTTAVTVMAGALLASRPTFADPLGHGGPFQATHRAVEQLASNSEVAGDAFEVQTHLRRSIRTKKSPVPPGPKAMLRCVLPRVAKLKATRRSYPSAELSAMARKIITPTGGTSLTEGGVDIDQPSSIQGEAGRTRASGRTRTRQ